MKKKGSDFKMAENKNTLPQTYGRFELRGIVGGRSSEKFCTEIKTKTGRVMKKLRFYVQTSELNKIYVELTGMEQDTVRFQKFDGTTKKYITKDVPWATRHSFKEEGFKIKGVCVGLEKTTDAKGKVVNATKYFTSLDAIDYINKHLQDGMTVFCKGTTSYSSTGEGKLFTALNIDQLSLASDGNELTPETIKLVGTPEGDAEKNLFNQTVIITDVEKDENNPEVANIGAMVVTSKGVETLGYVTNNMKLAKNLKGLKPYTAVLLSGHITQPINFVVEEEDDGWGEGNVLAKKQSFAPIYLVTGADRNSIDPETYSEEAIARYVASKREFGTSSATASIKADLGADGTPWDEDDEW